MITDLFKEAMMVGVSKLLDAALLEKAERGLKAFGKNATIAIKLIPNHHLINNLGSNPSNDNDWYPLDILITPTKFYTLYHNSYIIN